MEIKRVFQVGFDIGEGDNTTEQDRLDLCAEISHLIDNYCDINGKHLGFSCLNGYFNIEDMSNAYGKEELIELNNMELIKEPINMKDFHIHKEPNKIERIKQFIIDNNPTRKELVMYIVVDLNKKCTLENYNHEKYRGTYSTNIARWRANGKIANDNKEKRYYVTKLGMECKKSLYQLPDKIIIKNLKDTVARLTIQRRNQVNRLWDENKKLKEELLYVKRMLNAVNENISI